ncbi:MAG: class I SAM-dependent methyltransferase [Patescibacteria group bacterium]|jgi:SAM-dependent methyltransferase
MDDYKKITKEFYNRNAERYAIKHRALFSEQKEEVKHFSDLLSGKRVLDLGCGPGEHAAHFKKLGYKVKAIDFSERMVALAKSKQIEAEVMDIEDLKFPPNSFDGIWAVTSLLHIKKTDLPKVIEKLYQLLSEKGILYVCTLEGRGQRYISDGGVDEKRFFAFWERNEFAQLFSEHFELKSFYEVVVKEKYFLEYFLQKK